MSKYAEDDQMEKALAKEDLAKKETFIKSLPNEIVPTDCIKRKIDSKKGKL